MRPRRSAASIVHSNALSHGGCILLACVSGGAAQHSVAAPALCLPGGAQPLTRCGAPRLTPATSASLGLGSPLPHLAACAARRMPRRRACLDGWPRLPR